MLHQPRASTRASQFPRGTAALAGGLLVAALGVPAHAVDYINETFDDGDDIVGNAPASPTPLGVAQVTVQTGSGAIGSDNVADLNDSSTDDSAYLEYNAGPAPLSNMFVSFDLLNINPIINDASGNNSMIFSVGPWSNDAGSELNSNSKRAFGLEIYHDGDRSRLKVRVDGDSTITLDYDATQLQTFKIWANDHDTDALTYTRPDTLASETLNANSFVFYLNDTLLTGVSANGVQMSQTTNTGTTADDNDTLGRLGFYSATSYDPHFQIDNLVVSDVVPEPGSLALIGLGGLMFLRRKPA